MTEDWELDFSNPPKHPPPTICEECMSHVQQPHYVQKFMDKGLMRTFVFCDEDCAGAFYLARIRGNEE